jgi:hypothetical protein
MLYLVFALGFVVKAQNRFRNLGSDNFGGFGLQRMVFYEQADL